MAFANIAITDDNHCHHLSTFGWLDMLLGYIRPDRRIPAAVQRIILNRAGVEDGRIWEEGPRGRRAPYGARDKMFDAIRRSDGDIVVVSDLHRLASTTADLRAAIKMLAEKGTVAMDGRTSRRTDDPVAFGDMIFEAGAFYAQTTLSPREASELGKLGAAASPRTKFKTGRMHMVDAAVIWRDPALTMRQALAKINEHPDFQTKWTSNTAYRILGTRDVPAGRRPLGWAYDKVLKNQAQSAGGSIYFCRASDGHVKIGFSTGVAGRLRDFQVGHAIPLELLGFIDGTQREERALHRRFAEYRVRGEWFRVEGEFLDYLATLPPLPPR